MTKFLSSFLLLLLSHTATCFAELVPDNDNRKAFEEVIAGQAEQEKTIDPNLDDEVQHLLYWTSGQRCRLLRNKYTYAMMDYVAMMDRKYQHLKGRIRTTEEFIKYAGAGSLTSGEKYVITCRDREGKTSGYEFLSAELKRYREKRGG